MHRLRTSPLHGILLGSALLLPLGLAAVVPLQGQTATAPAAGTARQIGTVKAISGTSLTVTSDAGAAVEMTLSESARIQQLAPGSTDLKTAQPATSADITAGDRILVITRPAENGQLTATRVVLMKSAAIAQNNASRQADWQRRGSGGIVTAVDPAAKSVRLKSGAKDITIQTSNKTAFRRYAPGSVKFEEATPSTLAALQPGDQLRVRGDKSSDGSSISADEIVSGAFLNLAGTINSVDPATKTIVLKDLASKKNVTVSVSDESDLRSLPPEMAARFAARSRGAGGPAGGASGPAGGASGANGAAAAGPDGAQGAVGAAADGRPGRSSSSRTGASPVTAGDGAVDNAAPAGSGQRGQSATAEGGRSGSGAGGGDLSRVIERLPKTSLAELKPGEALMIVASGQTGATNVTAVTVLTGVEPLLAASPRGGAGFNASNWNLGGGAGEGSGEGGGAGPQ